MINTLHIENYALIEKTDVEFDEGLNILTGETGAGKSILLGALSLALGGKVDKGAIREEGKDAYVEAVFSVTESDEEKLKALDIESYDGEVILSRRFSEKRSQAKINGESVPAPLLKKAGDVLLDIYGQKENQVLLKTVNHLGLLDAFAESALQEPKEKLAKSYAQYSALKKEYDEANTDESERLRETDFLTHEIEEIESADLKPGEDDSLEEEYRYLSHAEKIMEAAANAYRLIGEDESASEMTGQALQNLNEVASFDDKLSPLVDELSQIDSMLSDFSRELSSYIDENEYSPERFSEVTERLDLINNLKAKYGRTIDEILSALEEKEERLEKLQNFDEYLSGLKKKLSDAEKILRRDSETVSKIRKESALSLSDAVKKELLSLNFNDVNFEIRFTDLDKFSSNGTDSCEYYISMNKGEPMRPLKDVASGGELSRIMLSIKTVLAEKDATDTMIFDEIDSGISGRTAQAVAEKLCRVSSKHQVILITHLQQIAAMADRHFVVEKNNVENGTVSTIHEVTGDALIEELGRMLGGSSLTDAVLSNARELKTEADAYKASLSK
jgi:DNA repair protein RecN (Recombination protein N)